MTGEVRGRPSRILGLVAGPLGGVLVYAALARWVAPPDAAPHAMRATMAVMVWMAVWWLTEATAIATTALLPLVLFPMLRVRTMHESAAEYAHPLIFLFLGGFLIALTMQRWRLDRRIALLTLRRFGTGHRSMIFGFMLATALLSAFVSNTATTAMMLPIAVSVIELIAGMSERDESRVVAEPLLLGIAYAATLGGMSTIIGTPPNAFLVGFVEETIDPSYRQSISFASWLPVGLPTTALLLPLTWWWLVHRLYRLDNRPLDEGRAWIAGELQRLGPLSRAETLTLAVFTLTAITWVTRPWLVGIRFAWGDVTVTPFSGLSDAGVAISAAVVLFLMPAGKDGQRLLDWNTARGVPWDILLLFGGGLSLAKAVQVNGVAQFIAERAALLHGVPSWALVLLVTTAVVFLTELTSNLATTTALLPILAALAPALDLHPFLLIVPATLGASCAFMMPVATPPNALVFGTGRIELRSMMRAGWWLNWFSIAWITLLTMLLVPWWFAT